MSEQSVRDRDVIESRCGASAVRELALLGVFCSVIGVTAWIPAASAGAGSVKRQEDHSGAGVMVSKQATAKEVGLPVYPGAKPHKDEKDDSGAVQMGIWGGSFGFKLAVMKMESNDAPEKIAEFYKKALARYGTVLNCSEPSQKARIVLKPKIRGLKIRTKMGYFSR